MIMTQAEFWRLMRKWREIGRAWEPARQRAAMLSVLSIKRTF